MTTFLNRCIAIANFYADAPIVNWWLLPFVHTLVWGPIFTINVLLTTNLPQTPNLSCWEVTYMYII